MITIYRYDNKIISRDNKIAISESCCCDNPPPTPEPCCCEGLSIENLKANWKQLGGKSSTPMFGNFERPECPNPETWDDNFGPLCPEDGDDGNCRRYQEPCDWHIKEACLRWVCRCIDENLEVKCEQVYGGASVTGKNLSQLVITHMGQETEPGCYLYTIEFFGWQDRAGTGGWISSDKMYSIYKNTLSCD